jgi:hypothetical protein
MKSDAAKIYELYVENAAANEQPQMQVNKYGVKEWRLHGKLHRIDGPAVEWMNGNKTWFLHDKLHREDGPAIEYDGGEEWWLNDVHYANATAWAQALLKMRNEPHDEEAVQKFVRMILTKDDLI